MMSNVRHAAHTVIWQDWGPKEDLLSKHNLDETYLPDNWYCAFLLNDNKRNYPLFFCTNEWTRWINIKATLSNAGQKNNLYLTFVPLTFREIYQDIALYVLHGIALDTHQTFRFASYATDPVHRDFFVWKHMGQNLSPRHRHFKWFFANKDTPLTNSSLKACPIFKVIKILIHLSQVIQKTWEIVNNIDVDE